MLTKSMAGICLPILTFAVSLAGCGVHNDRSEIVVNRGVLFIDINDPVNQKVSAGFRIVNNDSTDWNLEVIEKSCGCANLDFQKTSLAPGESTVATINFLTRSSPERRSEEVVVGTGTDAKPRRLTLIATTIPRISLQPPRPEYRRILDWSGQGKLEFNLLVCNPSSEPNSAVSVTIDNENIDLRTGETISSEKSGVSCSEVPVEISLKPAATAFKRSQSGMLTVTAGKYSRQEPILFQWPEQIRNFPESIFVRSEFSEVQTIDLRFEAKKPFSISCIKSLHPEIKVEQLTNDGLVNNFQLTIPVEFDLSESGALTYFHFESSFAEQPLVKVPVFVADY